MANKKVSPRLSLKQLAKDKELAKGFFKSRGIAKIKRTVLDENGEPKEEILEIEVYPLGTTHPIIKEFVEKYPEPTPPKTRELINIETGKTAAEEGVPLSVVKSNPNYKWVFVEDRTDEEYKKAYEEWQKKQIAVQLMIIFDVVDEFGIDKIDEFEQFLEDLGMTANQITQLIEQVKQLDFLESVK